MMIEVLTCYPDGRQVLEQTDVPDNYFGAPEEKAEEEE